jgi:ubiquinone biosynthesis protein UbiJ
MDYEAKLAWFYTELKALQTQIDILKARITELEERD